jgi:tetratricopeptide (TPR) repeat protein
MLIILTIVAVCTFSCSKSTILPTADPAEDYFNSGSAYYQQGDLDHAILAYDEVIQLNPNVATAYFNLGLAYANKGETANEITDLKKALELCGTNTQLCQYAQQLLQQLGGK